MIESGISTIDKQSTSHPCAPSTWVSHATFEGEVIKAHIPRFHKEDRAISRINLTIIVIVATDRVAIAIKSNITIN